MAALFGRWGKKGRGGQNAVELALDFSSEAITLYDRAPGKGWRKFASAELDDPEFPVIINLLRSEAESRAGHRPVQLWLPSDQILRQTAAIDDTDSAARRRAAFDHVTRNTAHRSEDLAIAVSSPDGAREVVILATFAATWREARQYASRWGFVPGTVSTRHHAGEFGADGPVFRLLNGSEPARRPIIGRRTAILLGGAAAAAAAVLAWIFVPSDPAPGPEPLVVSQATVAGAPEPGDSVPIPAAPSEENLASYQALEPAEGELGRQAQDMQATDPETGVTRGHDTLAQEIEASETGTPAAFPTLAEPTSIATTAPASPQSPEIAALSGLSADPPDGRPAGASGAPSAPVAGTDTARAPAARVPSLPEPSHGPPPPELAALDAAKQGDLISRHQGVVTAPNPMTPASLKRPALLAAKPLQIPVRFDPDPVVAWFGPLPEPGAPVQVAAIWPLGDAAGMAQPGYVEDAPPLVPAAVPPPPPAVSAPEPPAPNPAPATQQIAAQVPATAPAAITAPAAESRTSPRPLTPRGIVAPATPAALPATAAPAAVTPAGSAAEAESAPEAEAEAAPARPINVPVPLPPVRPAGAEPPEEAGPAIAAASDSESPLAKILPPPRPAQLNRPEAETLRSPGDAPVPAPDTASTDKDPKGAGAIVPETASTPETAPPGAAALSADGAAPEPDTPAPQPAGSRLAALEAPKPLRRPAQPKFPSQVAAPGAALPKLTAPVAGSVRSAATEPGLPLGQTALIGVVHVDGSSKALLRLPDGRYRSVVVGDVIEGWRVSTIGADAMRISRSGEVRTLALISR